VKSLQNSWRSEHGFCPCCSKDSSWNFVEMGWKANELSTSNLFVRSLLVCLASDVTVTIPDSHGGIRGANQDPGGRR